MSRARDAITEYFTMNDAVRTAQKIDEDTRARVTSALRLARQKRDAAEALDASGAFADALRLFKESDAALRDAWATLEQHGWKPSAGTAHVAVTLRGVMAEIAAAPERDDAVPAVLRARLASAVHLVDALWSELMVAARNPRQLARLRVKRWLECGALLVGTLFVARLAYEVVYGVRIRASSELSATWSADRAIDGDKNTDWVAGETGAWIELRFHAPRAFRHVWIRNGEFFTDRATKELKVELYDEDAVRWSSSGTFTRVPSETLGFDSGGARASRVRITVTSYFGTSAAISEITWD